MRSLLTTAGLLVTCLAAHATAEPIKTWDGKHNIEQIEVTIVYFVSQEGMPLPDWHDRVSYFSRRIEQFHHREYQGQSTLTTKIHATPFRSAKSTAQLRAGDGDFTFFSTLREVDAKLGFSRGRGERKAFPILLVLSDINWRELEDFYRLRPGEKQLEFEGQLINNRHFPGATSGGARATYLADRGVGWGLVSADGWRVPYSGTDCVVYHEGVGHTVGLPHPQRGNGSVMSLGQYRGWINESWLDDDQKEHLGWTPPKEPISRDDLFSKFTALPDPLVPKPGDQVDLKLTWPADAQIKTARIQFQTELFGPWVQAAHVPAGPAPARFRLGNFDRPTPVSYRLEVSLNDGQAVELWGYFQVRRKPTELPMPRQPARRQTTNSENSPRWDETIDLLDAVHPERDGIAGRWQRVDGAIESNKQYGARLELPFEAPEEYQLTVTVRPLDKPNGLILGQRSGERRFVVLVNHGQRQGPAASAIENIDGRNVGNATTLFANLLEQNRLSSIVCTVRRDSVVVSCDGREIIRWHGKPDQLSLSDYWQTPTDNAIFLGAYDCRYRFERITLTPITGQTTKIERPVKNASPDAN